jgi:hypothetical protein
MKVETLSIVLSILLLLISAYTINTCAQQDEGFTISQQAAEKNCRLQAEMVANAPYIGGTAQQAYDNCMSSWNPDMNMPSAYAKMM